MALSSTFLTIIIIAWGAKLAVEGEISVGALIGANILAARAISPIIRLVQNIEPLNTASNSIKEINYFLKLPQEKPGGAEIKDFKGDISIKDLQFIYPDSRKPLFESLNCQVGPGELMVIKGSNGSGKSTFIKLITRILEFKRGEINFDNVDVNQLSQKWISSNLIFLPQEPKFIDGTLLDNLLGLGEIKKDKMSQILKSVDLLDFVNSHPDGLTMSLTNRGEDLPFGVRKRIALARALIVSGQVVILDEPTESIDENGRKSIYALLSEFVKNNKTVIVSSQDNEIIRMSDLIIDLDTKPLPKISINKK